MVAPPATISVVPAGFWFAGMAALPLTAIGPAVVFLPLFVFLPRIIRYAMNADQDAVLGQFEEQADEVFWTLSIATAAFVRAEVVDPATAQAILAAITGPDHFFYFLEPECVLPYLLSLSPCQPGLLSSLANNFRE